ncbi:MAG: alkaline phosphatase [Desulfobacteraceae bacterium 4572_35.1]|nr:MAG: alkaline phosphatase [Desulfobacteraceae bacterium 4572_35.1]
MMVNEHILKAVRDAAIFNPEIQVAPACILWPDRDRQWGSIIPRLQSKLPELLVLGDYTPDKKTGPAIWLRCVIAGNADEVSLPDNRTPIIYLPGVSRQDLRAVEGCPDHLKPLAELQYRGVIWSQINAKDWTILAYLKSNQGGLGLDVAQDNEAKSAMQLALCQFLDEDLELLNDKRLDRDYFNTLLTGGDPVRDLLQWLDQGDTFQAGRSENEWKAFVSVCKSQLDFDPQSEGVLAGAEKLANYEGPWHAIWERFCEAPTRYSNIPAQIRKCPLPQFGLFADERTAGGWPQWNEDQEKSLQGALVSLGNLTAVAARLKITELEKQHSGRRSLVWAELGESPLTCALKYLAIIADITSKSLAAGTVEDLASGYSRSGWKADDAVIRALSHAESATELEAITTAIRCVYQPWVEESARYLQSLVYATSYPGGTCISAEPISNHTGDCILFVDGLRYDTGKRLIELLTGSGLAVEEEPRWCAVPSVTGTGKAAVAPINRGSERIAEDSVGYNFEILNHHHLHKAIEESGISILTKNDNGTAKGTAWCEFGDIDHEGHDRGWKLAKHLDLLLTEIRDRITALIAAGWKRVRVVTDHGWLLLPGGLPKVDLPSALADTKWGRCASLKAGASTDERLYPWYWNQNQYFALADGISCFKNGQEYTHGGLSLQECLTIQITVTTDPSSAITPDVEITDIIWKGLRCTVALDENYSDLMLDIRSQAGNSTSSVALSTKSFKKNGTASVVIENEDLEGSNATVVLLSA